MPPVSSPKPINLTEAAGRMPWSEVGQALRICARSHGAILEIRGLDHAENGHPNDGHADTIYMISASYGALRCGDTILECTEGDILFIPSGYPHHFEQMDGKIRLWRISLMPAPVST
jgi:mannose-6-phosphate isomerase-like protein (cupin superfamily)